LLEIVLSAQFCAFPFSVLQISEFQQSLLEIILSARVVGPQRRPDKIMSTKMVRIREVAIIIGKRIKLAGETAPAKFRVTSQPSQTNPGKYN